MVSKVYPEYHRPTDLADALTHLSAAPVTVAAGCTDLFPATERKVLPGPVLDITGIAELRGLHHAEDRLRIGATTTWSDIVAADLPPAFDGLKLAAREVGALQIQNRGTLAGNLCNASPAADGVPPLLTLDASVELCSTSGTRVVPLGQFLTGPRSTVRRRDELVTAILVPATAMGGRGQFLKLGARKYLVISITMVALRIVEQDGVVSDARIAVGACGPVATRLPELERALIGQSRGAATVDPQTVADALSPIDDVRADAPYRIEAATDLIRRALTTPHREAA